MAGGTAPENISEAATVRPHMIDVATGAESSLGIKDMQKVSRMLKALQ